jgi:hypothetical protein
MGKEFTRARVRYSLAFLTAAKGSRSWGQIGGDGRGEGATSAMGVFSVEPLTLQEVKI